MDSYGVSQKTATQRDNGGVAVGSQYVPTERYYTVVGGETPIWDEYVYDASNARIKEIYLSLHLRQVDTWSKGFSGFDGPKPSDVVL